VDSEHFPNLQLIFRVYTTDRVFVLQEGQANTDRRLSPCLGGDLSVIVVIAVLPDLTPEVLMIAVREKQNKDPIVPLGPRDIYTPMGRGKIVYTFPDGSFAVQFDWGGGHIFHPRELEVESILKDRHGFHIP
jgi:hypothetical protein